MRSLAYKLIIAFLAVSLVGTVLVALLVWRVTADQFGQFVFSRNQDLFVNELAEYYVTHGSWEDVAGILPESKLPEDRPPDTGYRRDSEFRGMLTLVDPTGKVVVAGGGHHVGDKVPPADLARGRPIEVEDRPVGTLILGPMPFRPTRSEGAFLSRVNQTLVQATLGATIAALLLGILLTRALTQPLRELTVATRAVAQGDLGHQVEVRSKDEMGELATSFNQMSSDLARSQGLRRQMTADIAHDLRTPLSVILGHAEALRDGVLAPSPETFYVIHDEALRLNRLVEDLRTLSLTEANELPLARRLTSPHSLLERVAATQTALVQQRNVSLQLDVTPDLPEIYVDPDRMAQVLSNLLENACRHAPEGGNITLGAKRYQDCVRLSVHDTGPGIAPEDLPRIFDRFYRADKSRQRHDGGSGLGLAIAKSLVVRHEGKIWAESETGQGATFIIDLPAEGFSDSIDD